MEFGSTLLRERPWAIWLTLGAWLTATALACGPKGLESLAQALARLSLLEGKIGYFLEEIAHRGA